MSVIKKSKTIYIYSCSYCKSEFKEEKEAVGCSKNCEKLGFPDLPKYVRLEHSYMTLRKRSKDCWGEKLRIPFLEYWVEYGGWGARIQMLNNKPHALMQKFNHLDNKPFIEITKATYLKHTQQN